MSYPDELIERAKYEVQVFQRMALKTGEQLIAEVERLRLAAAAKQSEIDQLMLEYCPGDMTKAQITNWGDHQVVVDDAALRKMWRDAGGEFHGPTIETGTMPENKLLVFLRGLFNRQEGASGG